MSVQSQIKIDDARNSVATSGNVAKRTFEVAKDSATSGLWFSSLAKSLWPAKPVQTLVYLTGAPERTVSRWVAGAVDPPARAIVAILTSDQGWRFLFALLRHCKRHWWTETVSARERSRSDEKDQLQLL
jgi:hypothetical protein